MTQTSLFVKFTAKPGRRDEALAALQEAAAAVEAEDGTLVYSFHLDKGDADVVWGFELYADDEALTVHSSSDALATLLGALGDVLAEPPMMAMADPAIAQGLPG